MNRNSVLLGAILIVVGIILGAFGAHALKEVLNSDQLASFETGVRYQMYHGLALLILGFNADKFQSSLKVVTIFILVGVVFFSGSIYLLALQSIMDANLRFLGPVTPIGGLLLIISWGLLIVKIITNKSRQE